MNTITCEISEQVATITMNRPQVKNALSQGMAAELQETFLKLGEDADVRAIVLTGAGGAFCSGGDVSGEKAAGIEQQRANMKRHHRLARTIHAIEKPVIAAVDGVAFGAGFSVALLADLILASHRARFCMAFGRVGLVPDYGAMFTLPRAVGVPRAKELLYSARELTPEDARTMGIVTEVLPHEDLLPRARVIALALCGASPLVISITKNALNSPGLDFDDVLEVEANGQPLAGNSPYALEAFRRLKAKEPRSLIWPE